MPTFTMDRFGGCTGAKTGRSHSFVPGDEVEAPEGEFSHLPDGAVRSVEYEDRMMSPDSGPRYSVREGNAGWWKVVDTETGEPVEGESERSKDAAQKNADALNANG